MKSNETRWCVNCKGTGMDKFCYRCGTLLIPFNLTCPHPNCEEKVSVLDKFCQHCGKPIQEEVQEHIKRQRERR